MKLSKISSANVVTIVVAHSKSLFHSREHKTTQLYEIVMKGDERSSVGGP